jgi:hypothetical protein
MLPFVRVKWVTFEERVKKINVSLVLQDLSVDLAMRTFKITVLWKEYT